MTSGIGQNIVDSLGKKDLNKDGNIINLAIVGSSRFYDFQIFEELIENWVDDNGYPDLIIVGGASGVDYMAERWADNNSTPIAIFSERSHSLSITQCVDFLKYSIGWILHLSVCFSNISLAVDRAPKKILKSVSHSGKSFSSIASRLTLVSFSPMSETIYVKTGSFWTVSMLCFLVIAKM